jgi:DNA-binding transcriptional regulator YhcF (GntR family)
MRFWLLHSGEVPLQDQIFTQVTLGVLAGELPPGKRLPSVRELARRFHIHSNTVSLAYRRLEREGWLEARRGSGMYVRMRPGTGLPAQAGPAQFLEPLFASVVKTARAQGIGNGELRQLFEAALVEREATALLLLEADTNLQRIVLAELRAATPLPVEAVGYYPAAGVPVPVLPLGTVGLVLPSKAAAVASALGPAAALHTLRIRSVPQSLAPWLPAPTDALVGIASQWPPFLEFARTMLVAAGFSSDALLVRNPAEPGWLDGLEAAAGVVCDRHTAGLLAAGVKAIPFGILADDALAGIGC